MLKSGRRLHSGFDEKNNSTLLSEDTADALVPYENFPCFQIQELFYTEDKEQSLKTRHLHKPYDINLPEGAFRILKLRMPTRKEMEECLIRSGQEVPEDWTKFNLHSTDSVDYIYVMSGEIDYIVGDKITRLKQGDFLAQIGPEHTWLNESSEPCYVMCIMVGIKPSGNIKQMVV